MPSQENFDLPPSGNNRLAALVGRLNRSRDALVRRAQRIQKLAAARLDALSGSTGSGRGATLLPDAAGQLTGHGPTDTPDVQTARQSLSRPILAQPDRSSPGRPGDDYTVATRALRATSTLVPGTTPRLPPRSPTAAGSITAPEASARRRRDRQSPPLGRSSLQATSSSMPGVLLSLLRPAVDRWAWPSAGGGSRVSLADLPWQGPGASLRQGSARLQGVGQARTVGLADSLSSPADSPKAAAPKTPIPDLRIKGYPDPDAPAKDQSGRSLGDLWAEHEALKERVEGQQPPVPTWQ